ncbi:hypothetical protein EK21DRAFT_85344 [Setomelanomma holmii]|uniref:Uncharacterized protein n=1 Tax=Setomelanomma holmii TaxID=210430 RepID=A0A9P4HIB4_9PLEO|nr:hypothetical protein EK21DRAFT_85344 [Setomelanomma holmii]
MARVHNNMCHLHQPSASRRRSSALPRNSHFTTPKTSSGLRGTPGTPSIQRSGATQTFTIPNKDDIYDNSPALIALLEEEFEPVEDNNSPSFPDNDINKTLAAFFYNDDSNSNSILTVKSQSTVPSMPTPRLITPATLTSTQFLKRKRQSSTPHRGAGQKNKTVWKHSRQRLPYEPIKDDHTHEIFYCADDNCKWKGLSGNATAHLRKHAIFVRR